MIFLGLILVVFIVTVVIAIAGNSKIRDPVVTREKAPPPLSTPPKKKKKVSYAPGGWEEICNKPKWYVYEENGSRLVALEGSPMYSLIEEAVTKWRK